MFEMMRRNTKLIMWITAASFVLLIFLAWGAEYQLGSGGGGRAAGVIGRVNGEPIKARVYEERILVGRENWVAQRGANPDEGEEVQLRDQAWTDLLQEMLLRQEIERRGIVATDQEVAAAIRNQPLPQIVQNPEFQTNGQFDQSKYLAALADPGRDWLSLEFYYRQDLPKQKLQQMVMASVKIGDTEIRKRFEEESVRAKVAFASLPTNLFRVDPPEDDAPVRAHFESHRDDYRSEEQAWIQYVRIDKKPTVSDTLAARDLILQAAREAADGEDFQILVSAYSEAITQLRGGEQGTYMTREQFSAPNVREAAFSLPVGQVSEILPEANGFHLIRVEDRRTDQGNDQVKIADIFVPITLSGETITSYRDQAYSIAAEAQQEIALSEIAQREGLPILDVGPFGRRSFVQRLGQISGFFDWAFNATPGKISAMEGSDAWFVIKIAKRRPAGIPPFEEVAERVRKDYVESQQVAMARESGQRILDLVRGGTPLEEAAKTVSGATFDQTDEFTRRGFARGLPNDAAIMSRVFKDPIGLVPDVVTSKRGAYVIQILSRSTPDEAAYAEQREMLRRSLAQTRRREVLTRWMEDLRHQAKIEDYRGEGEI